MLSSLKCTAHSERIRALGTIYADLWLATGASGPGARPSGLSLRFTAVFQDFKDRLRGLRRALDPPVFSGEQGHRGLCNCKSLPKLCEES
jgi:hypothetical protein